MSFTNDRLTHRLIAVSLRDHSLFITARALVAAMRRSPALPLPRVLQSPLIGLAGASALQPQRKKRKAEIATTTATDACL
ncbi:hypothetical protein HaLaN_17188 [Haematococcus lacustris]|uniref:Uncharacterized protein n=1 Tax=Haematococcus lacustris TaxID=44745 RepID=A0A699ZMY2_HAELA|nr:hypothetical protein HaLaN_17188 [Haematococcus lacustris]